MSFASVSCTDEIAGMRGCPLFVAGHQFFHFGNLDHVVVAGDGVFQDGSGRREIHSFLVVGPGRLGIEKGTAECVSHSDTVDDIVDVVHAGVVHGVVGIEYSGEGVVFGVHHVAQGDVDVAALGHFPGDLPAECFVGCGVIPVGCACGLESRSLESEEHGIFAFAAEHDVAGGNQRAEYFLGCLAVLPFQRFLR